MDVDKILIKSSSTSSLFISSTISSPNIKLVINSVACILHSQITEDTKIGIYYYNKIRKNSLAEK
jgi:hypothetical protein